MEKKINNFIKKVEVLENPLDKLNEFIEEFCVNSSVLLVCDFLTIKKYAEKLDEIKQKSLNNIVIKAISSHEQTEAGEQKLTEVINETFNLVVGIGEFNTLKFVEIFTIKNNISYAFVNLFDLKCEIFCKNNAKFCQNLKYYPPYFILVNQIKYTKEQIYFAKLNIFKYYYLFLEYSINIVKNLKLKGFLIEYKKILFSLKNENIINSIISLGLILNKYNIQFFIKSNFLQNDFNYFLSSTFLILIYSSVFSKITSNNLYFSRIYKNGKEELSSFENFNFDFNKFYILSVKNKILLNTNILKMCFLSFCENLKSTSFECFYKNSKYINSGKIINLIKNNKEELFLNFLQNFEIFNF